MNFTRYVVGLALSVLCTLAAFALIELHSLGRVEAVAAVFVLAIVQILAQLACFLHVNFKPESRPRLVVLGGAFLVVCILLSGSLWIMLSLSARMTPNTVQMERYMNAQEGF